MQSRKRIRVITLFTVITLFLIYLELIFRLSIIGMDDLQDSYRTAAFSVAYAIVILVFFRFLPRKAFKIMALLAVIGLTFFYFAQDIYYRILSGFFSFSVTGDAHMGVAFLGRVTKNLEFIHLLYAVPIALAVLIYIKARNYSVPKRYLYFDSIYDLMNTVLILFLLFIAVIHTIPKENASYLDSPYVYTDFDMYVETPSAYKSVRMFGLLTYFQRDILQVFDDAPDETTTYDEIEEYLSSKREHEANDYTGLFQDKDLIMIMAESFDTFAIDPVFSPHLYDLQQKSWNFDSFYAPLFFRNTADTEFMSQTGFYTNRNTLLTMNTYGDNLFPYTLPRLFNDSGYRSYAFHNYTDYFYPRTEFLPGTLGYDEYFDAVSLDMLEFEEGVITNHQWQSDYDLMVETLDTLWANDEPYFSYLLTVSGHLPYSDSHPIARENFETMEQLVEDHGLERPSNEFLYYHAANYELDRAIGYLMERLEESGRAEDTVIMLYGDHYAYGINQDDIARYDDTKSLEDPLSFQRVPMMIYHPDLTPKTKEELFASIDIMPTLANLFDLELDYTPVFGKDIFGNQRRAVFFSNGSMLTDSFFYDLESESYTFFEDDFTEDDALIFQYEYQYRQEINQHILDIDYFDVKRRREE
ncbi:MAG: LTA synthase family protein [Acholeplasmataceae bacterium]